MVRRRHEHTIESFGRWTVPIVRAPIDCKLENDNDDEHKNRKKKKKNPRRKIQSTTGNRSDCVVLGYRIFAPACGRHTSIDRTAVITYCVLISIPSQTAKRQSHQTKWDAETAAYWLVSFAPYARCRIKIKNRQNKTQKNPEKLRTPNAKYIAAYKQVAMRKYYGRTPVYLHRICSTRTLDVVTFIFFISCIFIFFRT